MTIQVLDSLLPEVNDLFNTIKIVQDGEHIEGGVAAAIATIQGTLTADEFIYVVFKGELDEAGYAALYKDLSNKILALGDYNTREAIMQSIIGQMNSTNPRITLEDLGCGTGSPHVDPEPFPGS